ncbi:hypothetical protein LXL04_027297 [Taraxacum kok-saghyz]
MATKRDLHEEDLEKKDATMEDRLTNLPEDLKLCILSSLDTKHAVLTSILSKSWLPLWTRIPVLEFNYFAFRQLPGFQDFVKQLLCLRDQTAKLQRLSLTGIGTCDVKFIKNFLDYAFNHSVEELEVKICQICKYHSWPVYLNTFCDSLKSLKLQSVIEMSCPFLGAISRFKNLRVLYLQRALITNLEPFLGFPVLEKLTLANCDINTMGKTLSVHGPNLSYLKISDCRSFNCCELTTPNLRFFVYHGSDFPQLRAYGLGLPVLDTISLDFHPDGDMKKKRNFDDVMSLLCVLRSAKSIRLFSYVLYLLSSFQDELVGRSSPFQKLESSLVLYYGHDLQSFRIAWNVKGYLEKNSPDAKFTLIDHDADKYFWLRNCDYDFF